MSDRAINKVGSLWSCGASLSCPKLSFGSFETMLLTSSIRDSQRLVIVAVIAFIGFTGFFTRRSGSSLLGYSHSEKRAFVAFLEGLDNGKNDTIDEDDVYYVATRVLVYQLLHGPETRTLTSIPVVVMCTKDVAEHKRARLEKDGAIVTV